MSYLVLARRWRPRQFNDLVGQDVVVRTLKNALGSGNLAHAYLLCGIRGVGKTTIARLMAMAVNCHAPDQGEPCGSCDACKGILNGSNLDVQEMDAASHTGVDDVREILDGVRYPPSTLNYKVYIIDEAHMLSKSAFNALLKTLEEPPERVLFILATTEAEKLPVTVRSRCQRFDLRRLGQGEISDYLTHVFARESISADADATLAIAAAADGSVRDALSLAERVLAYNREGISLADVQAALGLVGSALVRELSQSLFEADAAAAIRVLRSAIDRGHAPRTLLLELSLLWHRLSCIKVDASLISEEIDEDERGWLSAYVDGVDLQGIDLRYQVLTSGIRDLAIVDERMGAEMILIRLCGLHAIAPIATVAGGAAVVSAGAQSKPQEPTVAAVQAKPHKPPMFQAGEEKHEVADTVVVEAISAAVNEQHEEGDLPLNEEASGSRFDQWQQAVEAFGSVKPGVSAMLEHVICIEFGKRVRLALDHHQERAISTADRLAFAEWLGREVYWESQKDHQGGETLSQQRDRQSRAEMARLRKSAEDDPHVQAVMREMDAQLVRVVPPGVEPDEAIN